MDSSIMLVRKVYYIFIGRQCGNCLNCLRYDKMHHSVDPEQMPHCETSDLGLQFGQAPFLGGRGETPGINGLIP